jgi:CheY-like chemotaxis protein
MLAGMTLLLADDDPDSLEVLTYLIRQEGGTVRTADSAREALEVLLTWTPDVLLLDIAMPEIDGFALLATIRGVERLRDVPAVAVTAHAYERDRERCIEAGFAEHVPKPYDAERLLGLIADLAAKKLAAAV